MRILRAVWLEALPLKQGVRNPPQKAVLDSQIKQEVNYVWVWEKERRKEKVRADYR